MNLPIPTKKSGWLLAMVLIVVAFIVYYPLLYYVFDWVYQKSFTPVQLNCSDPPDPDCKEARGFNIYGWAPKYATSFSPARFDLFIKTTEDFKEFFVIPQNEGVNMKSVPWIFRGGEEGENVSLHFENLPANSLIATSFSIQPFGQHNILDDGERVVLYVNTIRSSSDDIKSPDETDPQLKPIKFVAVRIDPIAVFMMGILKALLLPPLSNGLLVTLALVIAWSFEDVLPDRCLFGKKENPASGSSRQQKKNVMMRIVLWIKEHYYFRPILRLVFVLLGTLAIPLWLFLRNLNQTMIWAIFFWGLFVVIAVVMIVGMRLLIGWTEPAVTHPVEEPKHQIVCKISQRGYRQLKKIHFKN